jgi:zinc transporter ZupT
LLPHRVSVNNREKDDIDPSVYIGSIDFRTFRMDISRRIGILVFCAVPAIVGGGIIVAIFGSLTPMWIFQALLLVTAGALVSR